MRNSSGKNLAHRTFLLCPVWPAIWWGWFPREGWQAILPQRLLRHVRAQVRRLQQAHHGELHLSTEHTMAPWLLRLQGQYRSPYHRYSRSWLIYTIRQVKYTISLEYSKVPKLLVTQDIQCLMQCLPHRTAKRLSKANLSMPWKESRYAPNASESMRMNKGWRHICPSPPQYECPPQISFTAMLVVMNHKRMIQTHTHKHRCYLHTHTHTHTQKWNNTSL